MARTRRRREGPGSPEVPPYFRCARPSAWGWPTVNIDRHRGTWEGGPMIEISLLGLTKVEVDGVEIPEASLGGRLRQVLEILALHAGKPVPKEVLADHIWEGSPPPTYVGTLESYVCVLRKRLGLVGGRRSALSTRDRGYVLEGPDVRVDVDVFRSLSGPAAARGRERVSRALEALDVARGPLLASEPYAAWAAA